MMVSSGYRNETVTEDVSRTPVDLRVLEVCAYREETAFLDSEWDDSFHRS